MGLPDSNQLPSLITELRTQVGHMEALLEAALHTPTPCLLSSDAAIRCIAQEGFLHALLHSIDSMIFALDSQLHYLFFNQAHAAAMQKYLGVAIELGVDLRRYLPFPDSHTDIAEYVQRACGGEVQRHEMRLGRDPTQHIFFEFVYYPLRKQDQTIAGAVVLMLERTEQHRHVDALRERSDLYVAMFQNNNAMKLLIDPVTGQIIDANPSAVAFYGYPYEVLTQLTIAQINLLAAELVHAEMALACTNKKRTFLFPHRLANGTVRQVEIHSGPVQMQGRTLLFSVIHDVTERIETENRLREANERFAILVAELQQREREMQLINQMNEQLISCHAWDEAYRVIELSARELFVGQSGALVVLNRDEGVMEVVAQWGMIDVLQLAFTPDDCWALRRDRIHLVTEPQHALICNHFTALPTYGSLCLPLLAQGETIGLLQMVFGPESEAWTESRSTLISSFGEAIKLSLSNLRLRESLRQQAVVDALTGLFNRRYLEEMLPRELHRVIRQGGALCVAMLDLDHFKKYNDRFGHEAGDTLLRQLGSLLREGLRRSDMVCRYGGEEFALILPGLSLADAYQRLEGVRQRIAALHINSHGQHIGSVTVSLGLAEAPEHGRSVEEVLRAADLALYQAKAQGRNRIVAFEMRHEELL